jgi:hypothetical protein
MFAHRSELTATRRKLRAGALAAVLCAAGATTAVAATGGGSDDPAGTSSTGTTETTETTETTTTTTSTTGTTTTTTTTATPHAPRITEIDAASVTGGRLRLRATVTPRGASVTAVRIRYRGTSYKARRIQGRRWGRTVSARGGDRNDSVIRLRVTACAHSRCIVRTATDDA